MGCLILGLSVPFFKELPNGLLRTAAANVAKYSYGIYLAHQFCNWFAFVELRNSPMVVQIAVFIATMITVPVILFHAIERPFIRYGARVAMSIGRRQAVPTRNDVAATSENPLPQSLSAVSGKSG